MRLMSEVSCQKRYSNLRRSATTRYDCALFLPLPGAAVDVVCTTSIYSSHDMVVAKL